MDPVKGGFSNHAPSNWIKPDACCDDKPYNTGVEVMIFNIQLFLEIFLEHFFENFYTKVNFFLF